ncbi:MAG TPA: polyprenyl synthetase family protein [Sphingobacteriaceae bacterium]|nr:polyprenyl synthetase family protein [Sphingobacteriaceae bacterium]
MYSISELQELINQRITATSYPESPKELYEPISYIMGLGGKRMRPALMLMACNLYTDDILPSLDTAVAIEVFHNFTLMHDDIMDMAPLRRGKKTVHEKWNTNIGILSGDAMLVEAYKLFLSSDTSLLPEILSVFNKTAVEVCEGQSIDMHFENNEEVNVDQYINMVRLKTSVLVGAALKIGSILGGANKTDSDLLYDFGVNLGLAFQMQDDILDIYGDPEKFGKQVGGDIISNKKTFLLIKAKELAVGDDAISLQNWLVSEEPVSKVSAITALYDKFSVRALAEKTMNHYSAIALENLDKLSVANERKELLKIFTKSLLFRQN